jgi:hypothetical protein
LESFGKVLSLSGWCVTLWSESAKIMGKFCELCMLIKTKINLFVDLESLFHDADNTDSM